LAILFTIIVSISAAGSEYTKDDIRASDTIVYSANQSFTSRIYLLSSDGTVLTYYEYENFHFVDLEVVNGEVYAAEAFAPRLDKINLGTGELDVIVDDWSLYYFYGVAFDGTYFYLDEWDLNRYDINGNKMGTASLDEFIGGAAWDGTYYWTLDDENHVKCWDLSNWPTLNQITENNFIPPSPNCRGLWFDGQYFWTAESFEDALGYIYQFDYDGTIINQWLEPAWSGWGICKVEGNYPPSLPDAPNPEQGAVDVPVDVSLAWSCYDPDDDTLYYDVYCDTISPPALVSTMQSENSYNPPTDFQFNMTYYWRIVAHDSQGDSTVGREWYFTTPDGWMCGDANSDGTLNIFDATFLISYLYMEGPPPDPLHAADVNHDDTVNIFDITYLISYLYMEGPEPECPGAE
jgi:hypothetical protein